MRIFRPSILHRKRYVEITWIIRPAKLHRKKYVETTWIFRPAKLHRKKYVEITWIFRRSKLHRKSTRKWRGNSSKFGLRRIDVISTSNRCGLDVVCPLGTCWYLSWRKSNNSFACEWYWNHFEETNCKKKSFRTEGRRKHWKNEKTKKNNKL